MTPVSCGAPGYVSYQKGIIQGQLVHRYASRRASALCSRIVFRTVLSLDVSTQTIFLYYMSVKYTLRGYFWCFLVSMCYALLAISNRWNQYNFSTLHRLSLWGHGWILILVLIFFLLIQTFKYQCCGIQVHFKTVLVYNLQIKSDFWSKCPHYIMGYIINLGSILFLFLLVLYFAYIDYSLCQI